MNLEEQKSELIRLANLFYNGKPTGVTDQFYDELESSIKSQDPNFNVKDHVIYNTTRIRIHYKADFPKLVAKISDDMTYEQLLEKGNMLSGKYDGSSLVVKYRDGEPYMIVSRGDDESGISQWDKLYNLVLHNINPAITDVYYELTVDTDKGGRSAANGRMNAIELGTGVKLNPFGCAGGDANIRKEFMQKYVKLLTKEEYETIIKIGELNKTPFDGACAYDPVNHTLFIRKIYNNGSMDSEIIGHEVTFSGTTGTYSAVIRINPVKLDGATLSKVKQGPYATMKAAGLGVGAKVEIIRAKKVIPHISKVYEKSDDFSSIETCTCGHKRIQLGSDLICSNEKCPVANNWILRRLSNELLGNDVVSLITNQNKFNLLGIKEYIKTYGVHNTNLGFKEISRIVGSPRFSGIGDKFDEANEELLGIDLIPDKILAFKKYLRTGLQFNHCDYVLKIVINVLKDLELLK